MAPFSFLKLVIWRPGACGAGGLNPRGPGGSNFAAEQPTYSLCLSANGGKALVSVRALFQATYHFGNRGGILGLEQATMQLAGTGMTVQAEFQDMDGTAPVFGFGP